MSRAEIDYLGEGSVDEAIARKLITAAAGVPGVSYRRPLSGTGKQSLDKRLQGLNAGVAFGKPVLVIRDLDSDAPCPADLVEKLLPKRNKKLLLRICVRESEAWLMADHIGYGKYCGISPHAIPPSPERLPDPKQLLQDWAAAGKAPKLRRFLDDAQRRGAPLWASLGEWNSTFIEDTWDPARAANSGRSPSLARTIERLKLHIAGGF